MNGLGCLIVSSEQSNQTVSCPTNCNCHDFNGFFLVCRDCGWFDDEHVEKWTSFENGIRVEHVTERRNGNQ